MVTILLMVVIVGLLGYIHRLKVQLHGYEHVWEQIESIADRNEDGSFNIQIQHLEDIHHDQDVPVLIAADRPSGLHTLDLLDENKKAS